MLLNTNKLNKCLLPRPQSVPQPVVRGRHHPHPFRLDFQLHTWRSDLPVPEGILLHGPHLLAACLLALLHVRPQPERGRSRGCPVRKLHRQADRVLGTRSSELLKQQLQFYVPQEGWRLKEAKDTNK